MSNNEGYTFAIKNALRKINFNHDSLLMVIYICNVVIISCDFIRMQKEQKCKPEDVFKEYYGRLCYFVYQFVPDKTIAEDLVQDAFLAYWDSKSKFSDHPRAIKDFLYTAVRNSSLNYLKREKVRERYFFRRQEDDFENEKVLGAIIKAEAMANLHKAVFQLPESCRKVFLLAYFQGLSNPEIAQELNISVNTVRNHKSYGLKILRSNLDIETFMVFTLFMASLP